MSTVDKVTKTYQKNILYFKKYYPEVYMKLYSFNQPPQYELIMDDSGYFNIEHISSTNKLYNINPELIAKEQVDNLLKTSRNFNKIVFTGTLLGFQISQLISEIDLKCIMIIEPNLELFRLSVFIIDYEILTKDKFTVFSINDTHEKIEKNFLEFFFTMFFYNKNISFLNSVSAYQAILDDLSLIVQNNIFNTEINNINSLPEVQNKTDVLTLFDTAIKQNKKNNVSKAIEFYLLIIQEEQYIKLQSFSDEIRERIYASYFNLGNIFQKSGQETEAYHCYGKCVYGNNISISIQQKALYHYGIMYKNYSKNLSKMIEIIESNLDKNGRNMILAILLSQYLFDMNQYEKANKILELYHQELIDNQRIETLLPSIPIVYKSQAEIDTIRENLENSIDKLASENISISEEHLSLINTFYLAFHNRNNKTLLSKLSSLYEKVTPSLAYKSKHCKNYKYNGKRIKLGFISNFLVANHPVLKFIKNIIEDLALNNNYDIHIFSFTDKILKFHNVKTHIINKSLREARKIISKEKMDVLIYPEIGMHSSTYFLAHARLAPIQCMFSGHPMTSGIENIDYYLSTKHLEAEKAQNYYSENLILFDSPVATYQKPIRPEKFISKNELNLPKDRHNYLVPAKLQKIHPDYDYILSELVKQDAKANIILFRDNVETNWDLFIQNRLLNVIPSQNITFLPWANTQTFYSLLYHADAVLEPTVFGYGTTAIEAFSIGTPIVTLPGDYNSGRATNLFYTLMNFTDLVVYNKEDYVNKAIQLAENLSFRKVCRNEILKANHILYNNNAIKELELFFEQSLQK